jgi:predicted outer membrane repeat protein
MLKKYFSLPVCHRDGLGIRAMQLLALAGLQLLLGGSVLAQNITNVVAPGGSVDIQNNSGNRWYFFSAPTPSGSSMARVSSDLVSVYTWPDAANFTADPNDSLNRIFQGEYLRVFAGSLPVNTLITIPYATPLPGSGPYNFYITVANAPYVTAINITDPSPTVAATVHWSVTFSAPINGVTAANFILTNPDGLSGATITSVTGSGANWTVTASTGTGTGLLGCSYVGHVSESPAVPASFTGQQYTFSPYPLVTVDPVSSNIVAGTSYTMSISATLRGGGSLNYQWYAGTSVNPGAATAISGATSSSYTVSGLAAGSTYQYFCRAISAANTAYTADSVTANVSAFTPVSITGNPASTVIASGQTKLLTVSVSGTAPHFQWYQGNTGDTSTPVGTDSAGFTTPALSANTSYWVLVYNGLPATYNQNSATAIVRVVTSLTGNGPLAVLVNEAFVPAPAFTVKDSAGAVVTGYPVTLTVNPNSASGSFAGASSVLVNSDGNGVVSAALTANGTAGTYTVTASTGPVLTGTLALRNVAQLTVTTTTDEDNGSIDPTVGAGMSLREAVSYTGTHPGAHTITFAPALGGQTVLLNSGWNGSGDSSSLVISNNVFIQGLTTAPGITIAVPAGVSRRHFYVNPSGVLTLANLTLTGGNVSDYGGSVWSFGSLTVRNTTFTGNSAGAEGGAIQAWGGSPLLVIQNSTIASNTSSNIGSAISVGTLQTIFDHVTMVDNVAPPTGATLWLWNTVAQMTNCIIARNTDDGVQTYGTGAFSAQSANNLVGAGNWAGLVNGSNGNLVGVAPANLGLGTLNNNGGPTPTVALLPGSPAINAGIVDGDTTDQRGLPSVFTPDIGAFEFQGASPIIASAGSATFVTGASNNFAVIASGNPAPNFSAAGSLPGGVSFSSSGLLTGVPAPGTAGNYPLTITATNGFPANAVQSFTLNVVEGSALAARPTFNTNGVGWTLNGDAVNGGPNIAGSVFTLTDGSAGENRSAWFRLPLYVGAFQASFTYQDIGGYGADGTAFVIQNDPRGTAAIGGGGGGMAYVGITPSIAVMLNLYSGAPGGASGVLLATNGMGDGAGYWPTIYQSTSPVNLDAGNPISVSLHYFGGVLQVNLTDTVTSAKFQANLPVNISSFVGANTAWVGITGSEGGVLSHQIVSNFTYVPLPPLAASPNGTGGVLLTWPGAVAGFILQSKTNLTDANWTTVAVPATQSNNLNQVVIPASASRTQFYRLMLP